MTNNNIQNDEFSGCDLSGSFWSTQAGCLSGLLRVSGPHKQPAYLIISRQEADFRGIQLA